MELPKHTCISCAYLCVDEYGDGDCTEFDESRRLVLKGRTKPRPAIRCIKGLIEPDQIVDETNCPKKRNWKLHTNGTNPKMALQAEQYKKTFCWTKAGVVIALIVLACTLIFGILNLVDC